MMNKEETYRLLLQQVAALVEGERDEVGVLANVAAALHAAFDTYFWTGFYLRREDELRLGPFQGPPACYRIAVGRGVCGTACLRGETIVVADVEQFAGHIACSSLSRSALVVPMHNAAGHVMGVLDIDSDRLAAFDETDRLWLEQIVAAVERQLYGA